MNPIPDPPVRMLITPGSAHPSNFSGEKIEILRTVELAVAAGIEIIQIREKQLPARLLFELVSAAADITAGSATKLLVNERFDIALAAGADGVHLTSTAMPTDVVRASAHSEFVIGVSAHTQNEVTEAKELGVDYAMIGPIFETPGKGRPLGVEALREMCSAVSPFPVIAVGGIEESNSRDVLRAGAAGFAAIRYLNDFVRISP